MSVELHRWTDSDGQEWVCAAYDHGPMCRLCERVDDITRTVLQLVDEGKAEIAGADPQGGIRYRLTPVGEQAAVDLITTIGMEDQFQDGEGQKGDGADE